MRIFEIEAEYIDRENAIERVLDDELERLEDVLQELIRTTIHPLNLKTEMPELSQQLIKEFHIHPEPPQKKPTIQTNFDYFMAIENALFSAYWIKERADDIPEKMQYLIYLSGHVGQIKASTPEIQIKDVRQVNAANNTNMQLHNKKKELIIKHHNYDSWRADWQQHNTDLVIRLSKIYSGFDMDDRTINKYISKHHEDKFNPYAEFKISVPIKPI